MNSIDIGRKRTSKMVTLFRSKMLTKPIPNRDEFSEMCELVLARKPFILRARANSPYDGCFWEFNYWLIDPVANTITDLYVSHWLWIDGLRKDAPWTTRFDLFIRERWDGMGWEEFTPIEVKDTWKRIYPDMIARMYNRARDIEFSFPFKCHECGEIKEALDAELFIPDALTGGNGGVGITVHGVVCGCCWGSYTCDRCNSYYSPATSGNDGKLFRTPNGKVCWYCAEKERCIECSREGVPDHDLVFGLCEDCRHWIIEAYSQVKGESNIMSIQELRKLGKECRHCGASLYGKDTYFGGQLCEPCFKKL